jgi:anthranilate phosphoribosyltransferase
MTITAHQAIARLIEQRDLAREEMHAVMQGIMRGEYSPVQTSAILTALRIKGETVEEIAAAARVMRELATKVEVSDLPHLVDTVGTGGDSSHTFNVSTAAAIVAAAAGARVAKHGNRSVSSSSGSADVLEALGVNVSAMNAQEVERSVREVGFGFMFAPNHHGAMKHAAPVRRELGVCTIFNVLGPLTNPAGAKRQVIGVFRRDLVGVLARVLQDLGSEHVLVVHGSDGLDELTITGESFVAELRAGKVNEYSVRPEDFGLAANPQANLRVANAQESKARILAVLANEPGPARDIVQLNAGASIYVAGLAASMQAGCQLAGETLASGAARRKLDQLVGFASTLQKAGKAS